MKVREAVTGRELPGDWAHADEMDGYPPCPECGAAEGAQCSYESFDRPGFGSEIGGYVHAARILVGLDSEGSS